MYQRYLRKLISPILKLVGINDFRKHSPSSVFIKWIFSSWKMGQKELLWQSTCLIAFESCRAHVYFNVKISNFGYDPLNVVMMKQVSDGPTRKNLLYEDWWSRVLWYQKNRIRVWYHQFWTCWYRWYQEFWYKN